MCANPGEAGVSVRVVKDESTLGLLEVLVESEPLVYEYRNQVRKNLQGGAVVHRVLEMRIENHLNYNEMLICSSELYAE